MKKDQIEMLDELIKNVNGQIAKSEKTREMVDEGLEGGFLTHHVKVAEQEARGEETTGIF